MWLFYLLSLIHIQMCIRDRQYNANSTYCYLLLSSYAVVVWKFTQHLPLPLACLSVWQIAYISRSLACLYSRPINLRNTLNQLNSALSGRELATRPYVQERPSEMAHIRLSYLVGQQATLTDTEMAHIRLSYLVGQQASLTNTEILLTGL